MNIDEFMSGLQSGEDLEAAGSYYRALKREINELRKFGPIFSKIGLKREKTKLIRGINSYDCGASNHSHVLIRNKEVREKFVELLKEFAIQELAKF